MPQQNQIRLNEIYVAYFVKVWRQSTLFFFGTDEDD